MKVIGAKATNFVVDPVPERIADRKAGNNFTVHAASADKAVVYKEQVICAGETYATYIPSHYVREDQFRHIIQPLAKVMGLEV